MKKRKKSLYIFPQSTEIFIVQIIFSVQHKDKGRIG